MILGRFGMMVNTLTYNLLVIYFVGPGHRVVMGKFFPGVAVVMLHGLLGGG